MQKTFLRETADVVIKSIVVISTILVTIFLISVFYDMNDNISDGACNVAVFPVEGVILPYYGIGEFEMITTPETVESYMDAVENDDNIKAILIEVNSPGGTPVASERIAERFRNSDLPVVGLIGDTGASGGYMIAAATDYLIASAMSDVGSIGVNMSYVEESEKNEEEGLTYVQLTTGKFKDIGSPNRPITEEEKKLVLEDLNIVHNYFVDLVSKYRGIERSIIAELADGSSMPGQKALEYNLIDRLGGRKEAIESFSEILQIPQNEIIFCEYDGGFFLF